MGKLRGWFALLLIVCVFVQGLQLRDVQLAKERWTQMRLYWDAKEAEAVLPLAVSMLPVVLSAIVAGNAIAWTCYTANGQQAWLKFTGAVKDGVQVTKAWLQEEIAKLNGVSVSSAPNTTNPSLGGYFKVTTNYVGDPITPFYVKLTGLAVDYGTTLVNPLMPEGFSSWSGNEVVWVHILGQSGGNNIAQFRRYIGSIVTESEYSANTGFNPADHPELYNDPNLLINCHKVMDANPTIQPTYITADTPPADWDPTNGTTYNLAAVGGGAVTLDNGTVVTIADVLKNANTITAPNGTVYNVSQNLEPGGYITNGNRTIFLGDILGKEAQITREDGTVIKLADCREPLVVDDEGKIVNQPPSSIYSDLGLRLPELDAGSYSSGYIGVASNPEKAAAGEQDAQKLLPSWLATKLKAQGVDVDESTITGVTPDGRVTWKDKAGTERVTLVDTNTAAELVKQGAAEKKMVNGKLVTVTTTGTASVPEQESDPGNPASPALPDIPAFSTAIDFGTEKPWNISGWIGQLPFIDVLKGARLNLAGASSLISVNLNLLGANRTLSYDFSQFVTLIDAMGLIIYACAAWYGLQLALLKRD